jgi:hypothetical protein
VAQCFAGDDDLQAMMVLAGWAFAERYLSRVGCTLHEAAEFEAGRPPLTGLASVEAMAAGIGRRPEDVRAIEDSKATEERVTFYTSWLARLEALPADEKGRQLLAAIDGHRRFGP